MGELLDINLEDMFGEEEALPQLAEECKHKASARSVAKTGLSTIISYTDPMHTFRGEEPKLEFDNT